ncbi:MAG: type II toxin-antitoxin system Phd/YefM family antitoxin [Deltaproteobacteria bacterium]|nr:type II toxin-antitoxin system Phd/YefM family antitoxin [Deltaproteobacteria bacterium]
MQWINASEFKAKCLAMLDEVAKSTDGITILKRGRPIAKLIPYVSSDEKYPQNSLKGSVVIKDDVIKPVLSDSVWEVDKHNL